MSYLLLPPWPAAHFGSSRNAHRGSPGNYTAGDFLNWGICRSGARVNNTPQIFGFYLCTFFTPLADPACEWSACSSTWWSRSAPGSQHPQYPMDIACWMNSYFWSMKSIKVKGGIACPELSCRQPQPLHLLHKLQRGCSPSVEPPGNLVLKEGENIVSCSHLQLVFLVLVAVNIGETVYLNTCLMWNE